MGVELPLCVAVNSILDCLYLFSGVELSIKSFCFIAQQWFPLVLTFFSKFSGRPSPEIRASLAYKIMFQNSRWKGCRPCEFSYEVFEILMTFLPIFYPTLSYLIKHTIEQWLQTMREWKFEKLYHWVIVCIDVFQTNI